MKKCNTCKRTQPYAAFNKRAQETDGYNYKCRECMRVYRRKNRDSEACGALRSRYGIDMAKYTELLKQQQGVCAVCAKPESSNKRLAVDHNHTTGAVRGLLCGACNRALGLLADSPTRVASALKYLIDKGHYGTEDLT